jgi:hypothetical protein
VNDRSAGDPTLRLRDSEQQSQTVIKVGADFYIHASSLTSRRDPRARERRKLRGLRGRRRHPGDAQRAARIFPFATPAT